MSKDLQKEEALKRMGILKLHENPIREFKESGKINRSEYLNAVMPSILFWLDDEEEKLVREFEEKSGNMVYHVIKTNTEFGLLYSMLYVSPLSDTDKEERESTLEEWEWDKEDLKNGYCSAYVYNASEPMFSEYGGIMVVPKIGGLMRVA